MTTPHEPTEEVRLNKYVASALAIGRRQVDELISKGKVTVNDQPAQLGGRVRPNDTVKVNGKIIQDKAHGFIYLALHKPSGVVCSRRQQGDTPTIYSLLPQKYQHLKPVGRLDKDSSGLLLLTNDGDFAHRMTHPSFRKQKMYEVTLSQPLQPLHRQMISDHGIELADGNSRLHLQRLRDDDDKAWRVEMHEGRNRQIRRTFGALGYEVKALHRIQFGPYRLDKLAPKSFIEIKI